MQCKLNKKCSRNTCYKYAVPDAILAYQGIVIGHHVLADDAMERMRTVILHKLALWQAPCVGAQHVR